MAIQTSYQETTSAAFEGQIATQIPATLISRVVEPSAGLGFGVAVKQGTADNEADAFDGSGDVMGITVRERSLDANDPDKFAQYDNARIMTKGAAWVTASVAVDAGDDVYVTSAGAFTNVSSGNTQISGAKFDTSTTGEALAIVRLG